MTTEITIKNLQKRIALKPSRIKTIAAKILKLEGFNSAVLSLVFVTDRKIQALNKQYLKRDNPTDVLAFDFSKGDSHLFGDSHSRRDSLRSQKRDTHQLQGEVIISTGAVVRNSKEYKTTKDQELILYIVHGILHLCGYDDLSPRKVKRMRKREEELLKIIGKGK